jgi:acetyltransferase-like isoleucine patch superfamily enzyme
MALLNKLAGKLRDRLAWLRWWLWLRRRVSGRIKLRGNLHGLSIAQSFHCDGDLWLGIYSEGGQIRIGPDVSASGPLVITAIRQVTLGAGVLLGPNVMITDHYHGDPRDPGTFDVPPSSRPLHTRGPIQIDDFVQIGANACVLSPATIGRAAILGANSVVSGKLQPRTIHAGVPARPLNPQSHTSLPR